MNDVSFPWRISSGGSYKRDTGSSLKSIKQYGHPDIIFVWYVNDAKHWCADFMGHKENGFLEGFSSPQKAMNAADEAWPVSEQHS